MSSKARSVAVERKSNETNKGDGQVNKEVNERPTVQTGAKQETNKSQPPAKKRPLTIYTSEFKAEILEFVRTNKNFIAVRQFGIPESTLRGWISKAAVNENVKGDDEEVKLKPAEDGNTMTGMGPLVTNQDGVSVIIDVPGLGHADSKHPLVTKDDDHKELTNNKGESKPFKISPKKFCTSEFREMVVKLGESKGWKAAGEKFGVLATTVGSWASRLGRVTKSKSIIIDDATKDKVVQYSKQMNSWKRAAQKFGFSPNAVACWGKKAGLKLKTKSHSDISDEVKDEIVKYGVKHNSWNQAACKFGVPPHAVAFWGKKAGCKLKPRYTNGFKETVVSFGEGESWKTAAARFGVSVAAVGMWAKQMGKEKRVVLGEEAKQEIMKFGVEHNSWKEAAHKFGVSPHTVSFWGKKAGYELKRTGSKKKSSSGELTNSDLNNSQNQGLPLGSKCLIDEDLEKENADDQGLRNTAERFGVGNRVMFKWSKKLKVSRVDSDSRCAKLEPGQTWESGSHTGDTKLIAESPVKSNAAYNIASVVNVDTEKYEIKVKCEACGKALAADETLDEHVVSVHLTIEGLCNICGEDSEDFVDHFNVHLKSYQDDVELAPLESIKKEVPDVNDNQNSKNYTESDLAVKEEFGEEVGEFLNGKQWFINPFYSS